MYARDNSATEWNSVLKTTKELRERRRCVIFRWFLHFFSFFKTFFFFFQKKKNHKTTRPKYQLDLGGFQHIYISLGIFENLTHPATPRINWKKSLYTL